MAERIEYWGRLKAKRLTKEEELAAWERGDKEALLMSQLPFVCKVANRIARERGFDDRDLCVAAGMEGLWCCLERFDPVKNGTRLSTWCSLPVRWAVQKAILAEVGKVALNHDTLSVETTKFGVVDNEPLFLRDILPADDDTTDVEDLHECIERLPEKEKEFARLYLKAGSAKKAGRKFGMTPNASAELMQLIRRKLKDSLTV